MGVILAMFCSLAMAGGPTTAPAGKSWQDWRDPSNQLTGTTREGVLLREGEKSGEEGRLIFDRQGRFMATACEKWGFAAVPYQTKETIAPDHIIYFRAVAVNGAGEKMKWDGKVTGRPAPGPGTPSE